MIKISSSKRPSVVEVLDALGPMAEGWVVRVVDCAAPWTVANQLAHVRLEWARRDSVDVYLYEHCERGQSLTLWTTGRGRAGTTVWEAIRNFCSSEMDRLTVEHNHTYQLHASIPRAGDEVGDE